jgi:coenzyme F420-reducing hydrogenase delta subunit
MVPRSDARPHPREARVLPDLCAGCGICSGACPSSTPFRRSAALVTGIDMPQMPIGLRREWLEAGLARASSRPRIVVLACQRGADASGLEDAGTVVVPFLCAGMVPPSFIEYALRAGADGVLVASCRQGDCEFRCGEQVLEQRMQGRRAPALRHRVPRERVRLVFTGASDASRLRHEIDELRRTLPPHPEFVPPRRMESRHV